MKDINFLYSELKSMSSSELKVLSSKIIELLKSTSNTHADVEISCCRRCESHDIVKFGKDKNGKQRYKCKACNTIFNLDSYSAFSKTHYDISTWEKYIDLLLKGGTLAECATSCGISVQTAFTWRHKILNTLQKDQANRLLGGIVETDELYLSISYKGNHKKSKNFTMPRDSYERGTDNREQIGSRACVMCAIERNGQYYGEVLGKGQPTIAALSYAFDQRILPDTIVLSDKSTGLKNYFNNRESIQLVRLMAHVKPKSMNSPPEVRGAFHIQNVNNVHSRIRKFLYKYNGVATKYLNHYISLFIWIENHKNIPDVDLSQRAIEAISTNDSYISYDDLVAMPPIPNVA